MIIYKYNQMDNLVEQDTNLNGTYEPEKTEIHTPDNITDTMKKVSIDENKNEVKEIPALKPDTPKIALPQIIWKFLVVDTYTDSTIGLYQSNKIAVSVIISLVKEDLQTYINDYRLKILNGESIEDNRVHLANLKQCIYHLNTIDHSLNTAVLLDGKVLNRYKILCVKEGQKEINESDYLNI